MTHHAMKALLALSLLWALPATAQQTSAQLNALIQADGASPTLNALLTQMNASYAFTSNTTGITFQSPNSSGAFIDSTGSPTAVNGIDWTAVTFTGSAFKSPGFAVDPYGDVGVGTTTPAIFSTYGTLTLNGAGGGILTAQHAGTEVFRIQADTTFTSLGVYTNPLIFATNGSEQGRLSVSGGWNIGTTGVDPGNKNLNVEGTIQTGGYAIASLPSCGAGTKGATTYVTNGQTSPTYLGTVSTTGAVVAPVFCNGTNWIYH